jgi:hypothetical protein
MFNPSRDQARQFLFDLWAKHRAKAPLTPLEAMALDVVLQHPEYHGFLEEPERHLERDWKPEGGETNPFLHLMMHLAIEEQLSIDQPPGIRAAIESLARRHDSLHAARHDVMDCLAEVIWNAQRHGVAFDNASYLDCLERKQR